MEESKVTNAMASPSSYADRIAQSAKCSIPSPNNEDNNDDGTPTENRYDLTLLCFAGVAAALGELVLARLSGPKHELLVNKHTHRYVRNSAGHFIKVTVRYFVAPHWPNVPLVIAFGVVTAIFVCLLVGRSKARRPLRKRFWHCGLRVTVASFFVGTLVAAVIRFYLGYVSVSDFATGSAPIMSGILVGVMVVGLDHDGSLLWRRQIALMYLLLGVLATALGTIPAPSGWFWGACFLIIFGGLAASVCLTADVVVNRKQPPTLNNPGQAATAPR